MDQNSSRDTQAFLTNVADQMEAKAAQIEAGQAVPDDTEASIRSSFDAQFGSKIVYTACYSLSYGICFPIMMACHWIPKNNEVVRGLIDGSASASKSADQKLQQFHEWRLSRIAAADQAVAKEDCVESGVEALATA